MNQHNTWGIIIINLKEEPARRWQLNEVYIVPLVFSPQKTM
jgi:hypothetical protein